MRNLILILATAFFLTFLAGQANAHVVEFNPERTVKLIGTIYGSMAKDVARKVRSLATGPLDKPINLFINSYGGSVSAGNQIIDAIEGAQYLGYKVRCGVGMYAMSMAFTILSQCTERYTLANTQLMFHPARIMTRRPILAPTLSYWADELERINAEIRLTLLLSMEMDSHLFDFHFDKETIWPAHVLATKIDPNWLLVVKDFKGVANVHEEPRRFRFFGKKKNTAKTGVQGAERITPDPPVEIIGVPTFSN